MQYTAAGTHNRHFELFTDDNKSLGRLDYTSWFSTNASITLANGDTYTIAPTNFWQTTIELVKNNVVIANVKRNWAMNIIVSIEGGPDYYFKNVGFLNRHYALIGDQDREVVALSPDFQWSTLSFNYEMETDDNYSELTDPAFLLFLIYCCNSLHGRGGGAAITSM